VTTYLERTAAASAAVTRPKRKGNVVVRWMTSTDHKIIGYMYLIASFGFFLFGGVLALFIRAELFSPGRQVVSCCSRRRCSSASATSSCRCRSVLPTSRSRG
jgi:cytochrome c oxidase subunit 1